MLVVEILACVFVVVGLVGVIGGLFALAKHLDRM